MTQPPAARARARDQGVVVGLLPTGTHNAITDVPGVRVGHVTVVRDESPAPTGRGVARTGVTAIVPGQLTDTYHTPLSAGVAVLNGAGELTGSLSVREWGVIETPIVLTSTMQAGRAYDAVVSALCAADASVGDERVVIPVVGECDDSWLNDARTAQITEADVHDALHRATGGPVAEGAVGAGTGMITCGYKGGIGTSSRLVVVGQRRHTVGVLVLSNWGEAERLTIAGLPAAEFLARQGVSDKAPPNGPAAPAGSCIAIVATDAPLGPRTLERLAVRCGLGLARCGSTAHHGSGEIFLAFSTSAADTAAEADAALLDHCFAAVVEATEEAVLNALFTADTTVGRDGRTVYGFGAGRDGAGT